MMNMSVNYFQSNKSLAHGCLDWNLNWPIRVPQAGKTLLSWIQCKLERKSNIRNKEFIISKPISDFKKWKVYNILILHASNLPPTSGSSLVVRRVSPGWIIVLLFSTKYVVPHYSQIKVPITSKFLSFHLILYTTQWTSGKKFSIWIKIPFSE